MKELSAKIEQVAKKKWIAIVGSESDVNGLYAASEENKETVKFFASTRERVVKKAERYADQKALEQARKEAAFVLPLTAGLLEAPKEDTSVSERVKELKYKRKIEGLSSEEFVELRKLVS